MNAKKNKNKKGVKQPNPTPPQKEQETEKSQEKFKSEISDRADIISDIVTEESELPKKPKRNRGKKKKHEREDDKNDEKTPESVQVAEDFKSAEIEVNISESKPTYIEPIEDKLNVPMDIPVKVETELLTSENLPKFDPFDQEGKHAKKKNKKKKPRNDSDRSDKSGDVLSCTAAFQKLLDVTDQKPTDTLEFESEDMERKITTDDLVVMTEAVNISTVFTETPEGTLPAECEGTKDDMEEFKEVQKHESKKKKHKKDKKFPPKTEDFSAPAPSESPFVAQPVFETISLGEVIPDLFVTTSCVQDAAQSDITEVRPSDPKEPILEDTNKPEIMPKILGTLMTQETVTEKLTPEIIPRKTPETDIIKPDQEMTMSDYESPKPKAKIAKPVDKKRKGKYDEADTLGFPGVPGADSAQILEKLTLEKPFEEMQKPEVKDITQEAGIIVDTPDFQEILVPIQQLITDIVKIQPEKDVVNVETNPIQEILKPIEDVTSLADTYEVKKEEFRVDIVCTQGLLERGEQPQLTKDIKESQESEKVTDITEPSVEKNIENKQDTPTDNKNAKKKRKPLKMPMPPPLITEPIKSLEEMTMELGKEGKEEFCDVESIFETLVPPDIEVKTTEEKLDEILELKVDPVDYREKISPEITKQPEEKWTKPKRKGKKSLKMPSTPGIKDEPFSDSDTKPKETEESSKEVHVSAAQSPTETLEIRSVKADDSECSPCDVAPDIIYPRSTSQLNIDDNNNTVIREISIPDTLNLPTGITTPLIQGSGETPIGTPVMVSSFNITEVDNTVEKTDIKSKIVEVNKDMEELRLSIERSLAELTAIEKSEEEVEKKYEEEHKIDFQSNFPEEKACKKEEPQKAEKECIDMQPKSEDILPCTEVSKETERIAPLATQEDDKDLEMPKETTVNEPTREEGQKQPDKTHCSEPPPVCPARRDNKGKGKKRKGKAETSQATTQLQTTTQSSTKSSNEKREEKTEQKTDSKEQSKQEATQKDSEEMPTKDDSNPSEPDVDYDPIEKFEDALTSSADDVNKSFEMILNEVADSNQKELASNKPDINITEPEEDFREGKVPQPKNLLGRPNIPVSSNKDDFKKEKHKTLNTKQAKVKIKDATEIESKRESKQSQTETRKKTNDFSIKNSNENGDFIYKYSFRKVFLQNMCHVCAKELTSLRVACNFCNLLFYCSIKHKDEDWPQHQALCFAISTIVHLKDQKHIYAEAKNITGQNYRLLRMQVILSCEKVLKRRLVPWEQEALLYPRICADVRCREWRQSRLKDCEGCGQISYCANELDHLPRSHQRWCKSYALYQKLVMHQQTKGRLEPKLPTKVMTGNYEIPEKLNEVLASMYEEQIDMNDVQYAALTQIATAPLTVAYSHQLCRKLAKPTANGVFKKSSFVIHVLGAELQFEADVLNKWEVFFLHLRPDVNELVVVLISNNLNPGNLPLELLGKIRLCDSCRENKRRVIFSFHDKKTYQEYRTCDDFIYPDIVCVFNASINRSSYSAQDQWPGIITTVMRLRSPFLVTSHTPTELHRDLIRIKECGEVKMMVDPRRNTFASVRPDRNFITDDETPLLFKNQCFTVLCGV